MVSVYSHRLNHFTLKMTIAGDTLYRTSNIENNDIKELFSETLKYIELYESSFQDDIKNEDENTIYYTTEVATLPQCVKCSRDFKFPFYLFEFSPGFLNRIINNHNDVLKTKRIDTSIDYVYRKKLTSFSLFQETELEYELIEAENILLKV